MSMYKLFFCLLVCALTSTQLISKKRDNPRNYLVEHVNELPSSLVNKPVQYLYVNQLRGWSCGYNALYNACRIEKRIGLVNNNTQLEHFNTICRPYAYTYDHGPLSSSSNTTLSALAPQLGLQKLTCLGIDDTNRIRPLGLRITYGYSHRDSFQTLENKKQKAINTKSKKYLTQVIQNFNNTSQATCCHFICNIDTAQGKHWVLVSVTKNNQGETQLYVCDNMNSAITKHSQMEKYIHYLCDLFSVNNAPVTQEPSLPVPVHPVQFEQFKRERAKKQKAARHKLSAQRKLYERSLEVNH